MSGSEERWLPVPGSGGWYDVSDRGRVRSWALSRRAGSRREDPLVMRPVIANTGYPTVALQLDGARRSVGVHRLVMAAFVGDPAPGQVVCHWDDEPTNNVLPNLRYGSRSDNSDDATRNGRPPGRRRRTHCARGHLLEEPNLYFTRDASGHEHRHCRTCRLAWRKRRS